VRSPSALPLPKKYTNFRERALGGRRSAAGFRRSALGARCFETCAPLAVTFALDFFLAAVLAIDIAYSV
jgi:hypothetical protein